ncbi:VOC family protein [Streptomyces sp. NPDC000348]|uniref:VOC family protein n=1 Tax=Streptomyces sp. NPDC000348 TaxID=3364538 RepID=UPI0036C13EE1
MALLVDDIGARADGFQCGGSGRHGQPVDLRALRPCHRDLLAGRTDAPPVVRVPSRLCLLPFFPYAHACEDPTWSDVLDEVHSGETRQERRTDLPPRFTPAAITLDAPDARDLARFHRGPPGWRVRREERDRVGTGPSDGTAGPSFRTEPLLSRPRWPSARTERRTMTHPDTGVDVLSSAVEHALASGAAPAGFRPQADVRVLCDPAGHPFRLFVRVARPAGQDG